MYLQIYPQKPFVEGFKYGTGHLKPKHKWNACIYVSLFFANFESSNNTNMQSKSKYYKNDNG